MVGQVKLSMTAVQQIIQNSRQKTASKKDESAIVKKIEEACRKLDEKNTGFVGDMDVVNILGLANVHCQPAKVAQSFSIKVCVTQSFKRFTPYALTCQGTEEGK